MIEGCCLGVFVKGSFTKGGFFNKKEICISSLAKGHDKSFFFFLRWTRDSQDECEGRDYCR